MAIGDTLNQNPFGTNYNAEEEERKKAELAAQGARIGAGVGTPSNKVFIPSFGMAPQSLVDQVTQLPPMQEPTPIEVAPTITNNAASGGMQLREPKQTDGGVLGFGSADVESPFAITGTSDFSNLNLSGVNLQIPPELQFKTPGTGEMGLTNLFQEGSLPRMVTEAAGATGDFAMDKGKDLAQFLTGQEFFTGDKTASEVEGNLAFLQNPEVQASMQAAQAPSGASALGATQGVTPPVETPSEGAQGQGAAQVPTAPTGGLTTVGGASLSEFLSGQAMPEQGFTQEESPLGGRGVTLTQDQMNQLSAERESRIGADQAISDRDRRAARGDGISMADQVDMAKANARGATPREVARGNQVANALGLDLKTGQPIEATGGLTFDQIMKLEEFDFKRGQEAYKRAQDDLIAQGKKTEAFEQDSALLRQVSGDAGRIGRLTNEAIGLTTEPGTTALSGSLLKLLPGSNANQLEAVLEVLQSKVALDRLMEVKKTGATLGQVSEKELAMLQNSYDALKQGLKPERLREALTNYANQLKKVEDQTQRAFIDKHGQDKFNRIMGGGSMGQGEPRYANDQDVGDSVDTYYNPSK
jgi:hypothetical protein